MRTKSKVNSFFANNLFLTRRKQNESRPNKFHRTVLRNTSIRFKYQNRNTCRINYVLRNVIHSLINPSVLAKAGMEWGAIFLATIIASVIGTLVMGLVANVPYAQAPGMGTGAFFTYTVSPVLFKDAFFTFLGVTKELYPLTEQYLTIVMWLAPVFVMYHILSVSVRTDSKQSPFLWRR